MSKTLVIGWDAADWKLLNPLLEAGKMPTLQRLLRQAASGNLATLQPVLSPLLWTSIATGRRAYEHDILSFVDGVSDGKATPVRGHGRKTKAFWNILEEAGLRCALINWWPSYPCEKLQGPVVSDRYAATPPEMPLAEGVVKAPGLETLLSELRVRPEELTPAHLQPFFPDIPASELADDPVVQRATDILAQCATVHNAATLLLEREDWDVAAVYYQALDHFCHLAMKYHPARLEGVSEKDFRRYHYVVEAAYRYHDMMLEKLLELAGPEVRVLLLSDHGFQSGHLRTAELPDVPAAPAVEHRPYGIGILAGPGIKPGSNFFGANLLDVMPTLLHWHGLPVGEDLPGRVWQEVFQDQNTPGQLPSWEDTAPLPGWQEVAEAPSKTDERLAEQLTELGYLREPSGNFHSWLRAERSYNRALSLLDAGLHEAAMAAGEQAYKEDPSGRHAILWAELLLRNKQWQALEEIMTSWPPEEAESAYGLFLQGQYKLRLGKPREALAFFEKVEKLPLGSPQLLLEMARSLFLTGELVAAKHYYQRVLELDPEQAAALSGLGEVLLEQGAEEAGVNYLEKSTALRFFQPHAHYLLARSLQQNGEGKAAWQALQVALQQAPRHQKAQALAQQMAHRDPKEEELATVVVSGFPRSGTSLLMQVLAAGGYPVCADERRAADAHNPAGYLEWAPVKDLPEGAPRWEETRGKAVKVVGPLLRHLPPDRPYLVLWMDRPLLEVLLSQQKMKGAAVRDFPFQLAQDFEKEEQRLLRWLDQQPHIYHEKLAYHDFIEAPEQVLQRLEALLPQAFDPEAARQAIRPELYRHKIG
jgi:predicted AlkP superfamily phosphohydrolase/phosphomutase/tetratricopeptide (TPR) repeat protein